MSDRTSIRGIPCQPLFRQAIGVVLVVRAGVNWGVHGGLGRGRVADCIEP